MITHHITRRRAVALLAALAAASPSVFASPASAARSEDGGTYADRLPGAPGGPGYPKPRLFP